MRPPGAVQLADLAATAALAAATLAALPAGSLLILTGPLGVGKTTFTQALVAQLAPDVAVSSPTYGLVHEYPTPAGPVVHMDAYRLGDARLIDELGLDDYLERSRLVVVEWGAELAPERPDACWLELGFDRDAAAPEPVAGAAEEGVRWALWRRAPASAEARTRDAGLGSRG